MQICRCWARKWKDETLPHEVLKLSIRHTVDVKEKLSKKGEVYYGDRRNPLSTVPSQLHSEWCNQDTSIPRAQLIF